jgi:hypothetical protein
MSINKWKDTNIYGNFKNKNLYTDATSTTLVESATAVFDGTVTVTGLLTTNAIAATDITVGGADLTTIYQTILGMSVYQTIASMPSLAGYQTIAGMSIYQTIASMPSLSGYQTIAGMSIYQTIASMPSLAGYLTSSLAATTYQTISGMSSYQLISSMPSLTGYLTSSLAASTYQTISGMSSYLLSSVATSTYQTISGMSSYLTTANAASTYLTQTNAATLYEPVSSITNYATLSFVASVYQPLINASTNLYTKLLTTGEINVTSNMSNYVGDWGFKLTGTQSQLCSQSISAYSTSYALGQTTAGVTTLNSGTGNNLAFAIGNSIVAYFSSSSTLTLYGSLVGNGITATSLSTGTLAVSSTSTLKSVNIGSTKTVSGFQFGNAQASSNATYTVVFPSNFAYTPIVTCTVCYGGLAYPSVNVFITSTSNSSFQYNCFFTGSSHSESFVSVNWIACC